MEPNEQSKRTDGVAIVNRSRWVRRALMGLLLLFVVVALSGCKTFGFYAQAIKGQYQIFAHEQAATKLLADPHTDAALRGRLELLEQLRSFAAEELKLPVDGHYRKYVDVHRPFVVWNVEAAPEFSLQAKTWWYPVIGTMAYRGYFSKQGATNYAHYLRRKGYDVSVGGVEAYSTLGWFKDPVLNTFIFNPDADLAETIFHELGHQQVFARGDTDFNEAFATTVGQEGARRWLKAKGDTGGLERYLAHLHRNDQFVHLVMRTRVRLEAIYGDELTEGGKVKATREKADIPRQALREQKHQVLTEMRNEYAGLKQQWGGDTEFDGWFSHDLNNAHLNSVAAYFDFVPGFEQLLSQNGGDLVKFYAAADRLSHLTKNERHAELAKLARSRGATVAAH
jgi:predicted aminopeptidase